MRSVCNQIVLLFGLLPGLFCIQAVSTAYAAEKGASCQEETMLMFVGEEQPVVTVASRQPEAPLDAPAMMTIINRDDIDRHGYQTMADLLADQVGFFMAPRGQGTAPYLRGLPDSVLFLYDGVPLTTDVTKGLGVLDREISMAAIDHVEISRGPGSVLWGQDAFAGVVNIVPLRGRQHQGPAVAVQAGTNLQNTDFTWGFARQQWDALLAFSGSREEYQTPDYAIQRVAGQSTSGTIDHSEYLEFVGTFNYGDWFHLTSRWSDFNRRYTMHNFDSSLSWPAEKQAPVNLLKVEINKVIGPSHYTLMAYLQNINYLVQDADLAREQKSSMEHLELRWDRRLFSRGLFTAGTSWRRNMVRGAVVHDGFLPDFLAPSLPIFVPVVQQEDFDNELVSIFSQARYKWGDVEYWAGGRLDKHNQYGTTNSYSLGFNWSLSDHVHLKTSYGNAFRSPFSSQLFGEEQFEPESILTASSQLTWTPKRDYLLELTIFQSSLKNHSAEDPYGGLSLPSEQKVKGLEISGKLPLSKALKLNCGLTIMPDENNQEQFSKLRFSFTRPDGTQISIFDEWTEPLDQGPLWLANISLNWQIGQSHNLLISSRFSDSIDFSDEKGTVTGSYHQPILMALTYRRPGFSKGQDEFLVNITNLLDQDYQQPDTFGPTIGPTRKISLLWRCGF